MLPSDTEITLVGSSFSQYRNLLIFFIERPLISNKNLFYYGVEGDLVLKVPCNVTGFPDPIITWKRKGQALKMGKQLKLSQIIKVKL